MDKEVIVMSGTGIGENVLIQITELAKKNGVEKVILFGSRARGNYWRASDIDLAVRGGDIANFTLDLEEQTDTLLTFDVVNLEEKIQDTFRESVEKEGKILYEKIL